MDILDEMKPIVKSVIKERFWIDWYGAYDLDPKYLVIWICVKTDATKHRLQTNKELLSRLRELFNKYNYPTHSVEEIQLGFESQETVDRVSKGNWYNHFK